MILQTKRLILRPWCEDDAEDLYTYASDPAVALPAGWQPHTSVEHSRRIIRTVLCKPTVFAVCRRDSCPVGNVHLDFDTALRQGDCECELGYWLGKPFWGMGLITEASRTLLDDAFERYALHAVWCGYYDGNERSRRVQEKLGFIYHHTDTVKDPFDPEQMKTVHRTRLTKEIWKG